VSGRPREPGPKPCGWVGPDGEFCYKYGPTVKGLCVNHYAGLTASLRAAGLTHQGRVLPTSFCLCPESSPGPVEIWGGIVVPGALMCSTCGRCVIEEGTRLG